MNINSSLTFVIGISGVGKTQIIRKFVSSNPEYLHIEASTIIKKNLKIDKDKQIQYLSKEEIFKNQYDLIKELSKYRKIHQKIILDGHLLIEINQEATLIPLSIIKKISPNQIILIQGKPEEIIEHRSNDSHKKRPAAGKDIINKKQNLLEKYAHESCKELNIKFEILNFLDYNRFVALLRQNV
jgi:adenylate kinase